MRCIINVAIGGRYPKEQQRLKASLEGRFDGAFLHWTEFPNQNYNTANHYNAKAAAFEEAIKQGYKQILWVDSPVVALKDVGPIFHKIATDGYLTIKNSGYNCSQTCSDACLAYFGVTRDQAEGYQEHASGVIGISMENPKAKELIKIFIQACKDGACDGSRYHDGQSTDPRFMFHRQDQSVLSVAANILGLPPTMEFNRGMITVCPNNRSDSTILCWSHRRGQVLPYGTENKKQGGGRNGTRRSRQRQRGGSTRKHSNESYIYLKTTGGLNDNLIQLARCTKYAIQHRRSIVLEMPTYSATDISTIFDFSHFPVPIYTDTEQKKKELAHHPIIPSYYGTLFSPAKGSAWVGANFSAPDGQPMCFDLTKPYPHDTVLVYACGGGGGDGDESVNILDGIRFKPDLLEYYRKKVEEYGVPEEYISIHLRATDRKLNIRNNITGMNLADSNRIIKGMPSSGNTHKDALKKIDAFIKAHSTLPIFVASDNAKLVDRLAKRYPAILTSNAPDKSHNKCDSNRSCQRLHSEGKSDPENLKNAIVDLLLLANAKAIMTSAGGYSRLAKKLLKRKDILAKLLAPA